MELLIGTYTERKPHVDGHAPGLLRASYDEQGVSRASLAAPVTNPSWVVRTRDSSRIYCGIESANGRVAGFARNESGRLTILGVQSSGGADPAHLALHPSERLLAVANYSGGTVAVLPLDRDGRPGRASSVYKQPAPTVPAGRQEAAHPHHVEFDPVTGDLLVADLGLDRICVFAVTADGALDPRSDCAVMLPAGTGPRQLTFDETGDRLFVLGELGNVVYELRRTAERFEIRSRLSTLPNGDAAERDTGAALLYSSRHSRLYVTTRGQDVITVIDTSGPRLRRVAAVPSGGRTPRAATLAPDGRLVVAHQDDDAVVTFDLAGDGVPEVVGRATVPSPVCLCYM